MRYPKAIADILKDAACQPENTGKSGAQVLVFPDYVLKIRPADSWDTVDTGILRWLEGRLPVPRVAAHAVEEGTDWLLMTRVRGRMLCDPWVMERPHVLLDAMAEALHLLWSVPAENLPFGRTVEQELDQAERYIASGRFDPSDCEPETFGPGGFEDPAALLSWLRRNQPPMEKVLTHGDFCLPNLFTDGAHLSGMIDLGSCGAGDRWRDLALGWRSIRHNSDGRYGLYSNVNADDLFRAAGVPKDADRLRYYLLLDELF